MKAALGLGSNLGDRSAYLRVAEDGLRELGPTVVSSYHETEPVGPPQPRYLNAAAVVECELEPADLHAFCKELEDRAGRVRGDRWGPRTLDVDLLLCDDQLIESETLTLPHPGLAERLFVLAPLSEIAGDWVVPGLDRTVDQLHADCRDGR
ncbi:MAG: 2-amino-4-hydroxy-6-hydroxymethyldihydropteridine diphosphokinase [Planctomycetota bacterium]|jgi:2-amino-4-hydroxy-6-hydroxymethyldihydropteridine diphosphokinase